MTLNEGRERRSICASRWRVDAERFGGGGVVAGRILRRGRLLGLAALFLVSSTVVFLGLEGGSGILLHVTQSIWLALLVYPVLYLLAFLLLGLMVPHGGV
ncbi:hypothetical protein [Streptomyces sp. NPDC047043]|uniref:hypothetical protein n=1 Tax=Streptomyces sp. NPDC047043 TaxID=3154497 RepID=UPI0033DC7C2E